MKAQINFKEINPEYDQEYANEYNGGKEGDSNWKYSWSTGYELEKVKSVLLIENGEYVLKGKLKGAEFEYKIPDVIIYRCEMEDGETIDFAVSKSILNKTHEAYSSKYKVMRFYFYINEIPDSTQIGNLIIDSNSIPKELLEYR